MLTRQRYNIYPTHPNPIGKNSLYIIIVWFYVPIYLELRRLSCTFVQVNNTIYTMRRKLLLLLACLMGLTGLAAKRLCVVVHETQGQTAFDMQQRPVVSFTDTDVRLVCAGVEVLYPLTNYLKLTIEEADPETSVDKVPDASFTITNYEVTARGCENLTLYTIDGKTLGNAKADEHGVASIPIGQLHKGVYVVKTNNNTFKISKR